MSWIDLEAWLEHLPNASAFKRQLDPWAEYLAPAAELEVSMLVADKIDQLYWLIGNSGLPDDKRTPFPLPMRDRLRAAKAKAEAPPDPKPADVVDIRTRIRERRAGVESGQRKQPPNPKALAVRDRVTQARAAANQ